MARIAGIVIPDKKRIEFALPYIYGIGHRAAQRILGEAKIDFGKRASELTADEVNRIRAVIESRYAIEGELRRRVAANIKRLREIKSYRGLRHMKGLPARGQRTKSNSRTRRGNVRRTMMSGKRKLEKT
ncbi:MAG: 30S ribosomal protein S13 [Candidatus Niyogibacteria bacterium]|nr:30S ribosomal protein S13 [Candidatus Niyogibacteria bacterium]